RKREEKHGNQRKFAAFFFIRSYLPALTARRRWRRWLPCPSLERCLVCRPCWLRCPSLAGAPRSDSWASSSAWSRRAAAGGAGLKG
ncbi:hypothetical protein PENTCL1PPCAC_489, partial [Pristionchus entomophagus]